MIKREWRSTAIVEREKGSEFTLYKYVKSVNVYFR